MSLNDEWDERATSVSDIRISSVVSMRPEDELKDDEIKKLSEYYKNSRDELQKKVNSLLNFNFSAHMAGRMAKSASVKSENGKNSTKDFKLIDLETAIDLRETTVGSKVYEFSNEWRRAKFFFRKSLEEFNYGLCAEKNGSRGLILSVQAVLLKNLLLSSYQDIDGKLIKNDELRNTRRMLKPTEIEKRDCLIRTLAEILWTAGEKKSASVVFNCGINCFEIEPKSKYRTDGLTEKLYIYEFKILSELEEFVRKNLGMFQRDDGCMIFLYSLILSRKINKLKEDLQGHRLIGEMEECKASLFNLVLTGTATPYFHNGSLVYDSANKALEKPLIGIKERSDIGILYWDSKEQDDSRTEVGSMLKTPKLPIWLVLLGKLHIAVVFNTNIELINNWRLEQNFYLHFYTGLRKQECQAMINISTRNATDLNVSPIEAIKAKYSKFRINEEEKEPEIFEAIKSKWPGCNISGQDGKELMSLL